MSPFHGSPQALERSGELTPALQKLSLEDLGMLVALEERGTLTAAAYSLGVTQSALSHRLAQLEARLAYPLFERRPRQMRPTAIGTHLIAAARQALSSLTRALRQVEDGVVREQSRIVIATECYTCYSWLPPALKRYREVCPDTTVGLVLEATRQPLKFLKNGTINLAIMSSAVHDARFESVPLFRDELVAVVSTAHPWAERSSISPRDFESETLLAYTHAPGENSVAQEFLRPAGVVPAKSEEVTLTEALLLLVAGGFGVAVLARWAVSPLLAENKLAAIRLGKKGLFRQWSAVMPVGSSQQPHTRKFLRLAANAIAGRRILAP